MFYTFNFDRKFPHRKNVQIRFLHVVHGHCRANTTPSICSCRELSLTVYRNNQVLRGDFLADSPSLMRSNDRRYYYLSRIRGNLTQRRDSVARTIRKPFGAGITHNSVLHGVIYFEHRTQLRCFIYNGKISDLKRECSLEQDGT